MEHLHVTKTSVTLERRSGQACSMEASPSHATSYVSTYTQVNRKSVALIIILILLGDMAAFDGAKNYHANMVFPCDIEEAANLPSQLQNAIVCLYFQSQQEGYLVNDYNSKHRGSEIDHNLAHEPEPDVARCMGDYERQRLENIRRNEEMLRTILGNNNRILNQL